MPDYGKLRTHESHRVVIEYDTGARIVGYLAACRPGSGPVQLLHLTRATLEDSDGKVMETHDRLTVCPNVMTRFRRVEGPEGRDI